MRNPYVIANWKMQLNLDGSIKLFNEIKSGLPAKNKVEVAICPNFMALPEINNINGNSGEIKLGGQDVFWEDTGAYTGEISAKMLREVNCSYVIIGHSDRRKYFNESDEMIHYKIRSALNAGLIPIVCVGETFKERQEGKKDYTIINQVTKALSGIDLQGGEKVIVAYEPVWVIGSGQAINAEEAEYMHQVIKQTLFDLFSVSIVESCFKIIYGGSVNENIIKTFLVQPSIDGVLVGGASLSADKFLGIIKEANNIK